MADLDQPFKRALVLIQKHKTGSPFKAVMSLFFDLSHQNPRTEISDSQLLASCLPLLQGRETVSSAALLLYTAIDESPTRQAQVAAQPQLVGALLECLARGNDSDGAASGAGMAVAELSKNGADLVAEAPVNSRYGSNAIELLCKVITSPASTSVALVTAMKAAFSIASTCPRRAQAVLQYPGVCAGIARALGVGPAFRQGDPSSMTDVASLEDMASIACCLAGGLIKMCPEAARTMMASAPRIADGVQRLVAMRHYSQETAEYVLYHLRQAQAPAPSSSGGGSSGGGGSSAGGSRRGSGGAVASTGGSSRHAAGGGGFGGRMCGDGAQQAGGRPAAAGQAKVCAACGASKGADGAKLRPCGACFSVSYCGRSCQAADWKQHKGECAALKQQRGAATQQQDSM